ncbi:MAG: type II toxin-antitoxin system RelE/ParE family toxin [Erysipelotrichaceae bacterium]
MIVHTYRTSGGKDLIREFIDSLTHEERVEGLIILERLENGSISELDNLNIKKIEGKVWEIKFWRFNRIFYVLENKQDIYLLHACKKQKNAVELIDKQLAKQRAKEIK